MSENLNTDAQLQKIKNTIIVLDIISLGITITKIMLSSKKKKLLGTK